jgi:hypothetical protein
MILLNIFKSYEEKHGYPAHLNKREFVEFLTFNLNQMGDEEVYFNYKTFGYLA